MSDPGLLALELLEQANQLPQTSPERVALLEDAARHADAANDIELAYRVRDRLIDSGIDAGEPQRALVAFAWCLAQCDDRPDEYPESALHWRYKWMLAWMPWFHEVSREQIAALLVDMERRFEKRGIGRNAVAKARAGVAEATGDPALERYLEDWKKTSRDTLSDCRACDKDEEVRFLLSLGRDAEAVQVARSVIDQGLRCAEIPSLTYARALPALLRLSEVETAASYHRIGYPLLKKLRKKLVGNVGEHLLYTAVTGDLGRGLRILREAMSLAAAHPAAFTQLSFLAGAHVLLERIARTQAELTLDCPAAFGGDGRSKKQDATELARRFEELARLLARRFDQRNENQRISRWLDEWLAFRELELTRPSGD